MIAFLNKTAKVEARKIYEKMELGDNKQYNEGFSYTYLTILEVLNKVCKKNHIEITKIKTQPFSQDIGILYNMGYNYAIRTVLDEINNLLKAIEAPNKVKIVDKD